MRLTIRWRVDNSDNEPCVGIQLAGSDEEISTSPLKSAIGKNLKASMSTCEQDDCCLRVVRRKQKDALRDAGARGNVDDALA